MPLQPGTTLGPYQVTAKIGEGGMGEVYQARDTRLDRTVAIKVLPEHVAADPDLKQRFEREAKTSFQRGAGGAWSLVKVSVLGGPPLTICALSGALRGASWGEDDAIIFAAGGSDGLLRVSGAGGEPEAITTPEQGHIHQWPDILPGGAGVLFTERAGMRRDIALLNMDTGDHHVIIPGGTHPQYSPTGHIVYGFERTLRAVAFDLDTLAVTGDPVPVVEGVFTKGNGVASFDLSETGSLAYVSASMDEVGGESEILVWVNRQGREEVLSLPPRGYRQPRLSPDGGRVAVRVYEEQQGAALWVYDVVGAAGLRLTQGAFQEGFVGSPLWTPDGKDVVFSWSTGGPALDIYRIPADGSGEPEHLMTSPSDNSVQATSFTSDGRTVVLGTEGEIWQVPMEGERTPTPVVQGEFAGPAEVSPNGKWLAYSSNQSGQRDVYLQPYPGPGPTVPVSIGGGDAVRWSQDSSELFYQQGTRMMAVAVNADGTVGTSTVLFDGDYRVGGAVQYQVALDGRFLMLRTGDASTTDEVPTQVVLLVENWFEELKRLVPAN